MKLLILMVIGNVAPFKGIYLSQQDSISLNNRTIEIKSDEKLYDYEMQLYKKDDVFHLNFDSKKEQSLVLKFQFFNSNQVHTFNRVNNIGNELHFSLKEDSYHYQLDANYLKKGKYECSISPGYDKKYFHLYHF